MSECAFEKKLRMLDVLIRVISGGDIPAEATMSNSATEQTAGAGGEEADGMHLDESTVASPSHPTTGPALVENDMDVETPRSSLSDISASPRTTRKNEIQNENAFGSRESTSREQGRAKHPTPPIVPTLQNSEKLNVEQQGTRHLSSGTPGFGRSDSRLTERSWEGGSQGSSRDWGWFEDVHLPDGRLFQGDSGTSHADGKRGKDATSSAKGAHLPIRSPPSPQHIGPRDTSQGESLVGRNVPLFRDVASWCSSKRRLGSIPMEFFRPHDWTRYRCVLPITHVVGAILNYSLPPSSNLLRS